MWKWAMTHRALKERKAAKDRLNSQLDKILKHEKTRPLILSEYPKVLDYINERFPGVDVSSINSYIISHDATDDTDLEHAGGFHVEFKNLLVVKDKIKIRTKGAYQKLMKKHHGSPEFEDILLHELIHVVSSKVQRSSKMHMHMEEEFVYTNCIDFYKRKGMTEADIIKDNFFPFLATDVWSDSKAMIEVFRGLTTLENFSILGKKEREKFLDDNAEIIVPRIAEKAIQKGYKMIEAYNSFGREISKVYKRDENANTSRFSTIDFDQEE